jgi:hypothetical protein
VTIGSGLSSRGVRSESRILSRTGGVLFPEVFYEVLDSSALEELYEYISTGAATGGSAVLYTCYSLNSHYADCDPLYF